MHLPDRHPSVNYHKTYSGRHEAMNCAHVETAAEHHGIDKVALANALAAGISLLAAVISLAILL